MFWKGFALNTAKKISNKYQRSSPFIVSLKWISITNFLNFLLYLNVDFSEHWKVPFSFKQQHIKISGTSKSKAPGLRSSPSPYFFVLINTSGIKTNPASKKIRDIYFISQKTWKVDIAKINIAINFFRKTVHWRCSIEF